MALHRAAVWTETGETGAHVLGGLAGEGGDEFYSRGSGGGQPGLDIGGEPTENAALARPRPGGLTSTVSSLPSLCNGGGRALCALQLGKLRLERKELRASGQQDWPPLSILRGRPLFPLPTRVPMPQPLSFQGCGPIYCKT